MVGSEGAAIIWHKKISIHFLPMLRALKRLMLGKHLAIHWGFTKGYLNTSYKAGGKRQKSPSPTDPSGA